METPQSMFEDPSSGSKTTQYLLITEKDSNKLMTITISYAPKPTRDQFLTYFPRLDGSTNVASSSSSETRTDCHKVSIAKNSEKTQMKLKHA